MTDAILSRNRPLALRLLNSMLRGPDDYPLLVSAVLKQLKNTYLTKLYPCERARVSASLGLTPYTYSLAVKFASAFNWSSLGCCSPNWLIWISLSNREKLM